MPTTTSQLSLLSDHVKLSLLERQRSISLNVSTKTQDDEIRRSLDALRSGLESIESQPNPPNTSALRSQYESLLSDFTSQPTPQSEEARASTAAAPARPRTKGVRFRDDPDEEPDQARDALFARYTDSPSKDPADTTSTDPFSAGDAAPAYSDEPADDRSNQQIYDSHASTLREQDAHLDTLGESVRRQRMLGISIGDELDEQTGVLDDVERGVDRHRSTLDRGRERLGKFARKNKAGVSWTIIAILVLILLILVLV